MKPIEDYERVVAERDELLRLTTVTAALKLKVALRNLLWAAGERDKRNRIRQFDQFMDEARAALGHATSSEASRCTHGVWAGDHCYKCHGIWSRLFATE